MNTKKHTLSTNEVAEAAGIYHSQVALYARRLRVTPVSRRGNATQWPAAIVAQIKTARSSHPDPRQGALADDFDVIGDTLYIARRRSDNGGRRVLARIKLTPSRRRQLLAAIGDSA